MIRGRICVRRPETPEEWKVLIQLLEVGEIDDLPVSVMLRLAKVLDISTEDLLKLFHECEN